MRTDTDETRTINRCFMTGRTCIHEQEIQQRLVELKKGAPTGQAFVVMPFTADLDAIYNWQVKPFIEAGGDERDTRYACSVERADDVWQIGFIICTKICRRIQMASLVVVDLTFDNANVFYEFGIAAALRKRILPIGMGRLCGTTTQRASYLSTAFGIERAAADGLIHYPDFGFMSGRISDALYDTTRLPATGQGNKVLILYESSHEILIPNKHTSEGTLSYSFGKLCRTAASTAVRSIFFPPASGGGAAISAETIQRYREKIAEQLGAPSTDEAAFVRQMVVELDLAAAKFEEVVTAIQAAGCVIVDIRHQDPRAFFWRGYLHALGTHVIPVNAAPIETEEQRRPPEEQRRAPQRTMAFDIAGLWYAQLNPREPALFQHTLRDILGYFYEAKAKQLHKDAFWAKVLSKQPISVFLGTVSDARLNRNSLGDWDYRAAAEVTGYLTQKDYKVVLESPIIKPSRPDEVRGDTRYADELGMRIKGKNCIIIGSADINELTELVWATVHGFQPFTEIPSDAPQARPGQNIDCFIAYKEYRSLEPEEKARLFGYGEKGLASFILQSVSGSAEPKRGFKYRTGISTQPFAEPFRQAAPSPPRPVATSPTWAAAFASP